MAENILLQYTEMHLKSEKFPFLPPEAVDQPLTDRTLLPRYKGQKIMCLHEMSYYIHPDLSVQNVPLVGKTAEVYNIS